MYQGRHTVRPIEAICDEIRDLGAKRVIFSDDNVVGHLGWARDFFRQLTKLGVGWCGQVTLTVARDPEIVHLMKQSGCMGVIVGLESPNPDRLAAAQKTAVDARDYLPLLANLRAARIGAWGSFLLGFDGDTVESLHESVRFARRARLDVACFPILTPYPGTPIYDEYEQAGRILTRDWSKYNGATVVFKPCHMTERELANCQVAAFREFYSLRSVWERLTVWPLQKWAWLVNLSINQGFRYYYRRTRKHMPDFHEAHLWEPAAAPADGAPPHTAPLRGSGGRS